MQPQVLGRDRARFIRTEIPTACIPGYDIEPQPIPAWLVRAIDELTEVPKEKPQGAIQVHEDFDFDRWSEHYGLTYSTVKDDVWHVVEDCPGVGRRHEQSTLTAVFYDGGSLGWSCFAAGCPTCGTHHRSVDEVDARPRDSSV